MVSWSVTVHLGRMMEPATSLGGEVRTLQFGASARTLLARPLSGPVPFIARFGIRRVGRDQDVRLRHPSAGSAWGYVM